MSKQNYHKMYNKPQADTQEVIEQEVETAVETVADVVTEPATEIQMAIDGVAEEVVIEEPKAAINKTHAIVVGCAKLNVREEPSPKATVVAIIDASNEVVVSEDESFGNYYKVLTASGVEGYCIKDYLELK